MTKYIQFTYVDAQTQIPLSVSPAPNGISIPNNVIPTFDIESSRPQQAPILYGFVDKESDIPEFATEISKEEFFTIFKEELKQRVVSRRKQCERSGVVYNDVFISTTENGQVRLNNTLSGLDRDLSISSVDYEVSHGQWCTFSRDEMYEIGKIVNKHVQACFSACRKITEDIDKMKITIKTLDRALPIIESINTFASLVQEYEK